MKSFRSTWLMSLIVIGLSAYTYWDYQKASKEDVKVGPQEVKIFSFNKDEVTEIKVTRPEDSIELKKDGEDWMMIGPIADLADDSAVLAFIHSAGIQKGKIFRSEDDKSAINWADIGLEPPGATIQIRSPKTDESLDVSSKNAFDGSFYVRLKNEALLGDIGLGHLVQRSSKSFRSRLMWRDALVTVFGANAVLDGPDAKVSFKIINENEKWTLDPPPKFPVDYEKVAYWVVEVEKLSASEIVTDEPTIVDKDKYRLKMPSAIITLNHKSPEGKKSDWTLTVGQDRDGEVYMYNSGRPTIYKAQSSIFSKIRVPIEYFRDGSLPFKFPVEEVRKIELFIKDKPYTFKKDGSIWKAVGETDGLVLDPDKLVKLVQDLNIMKAEEFLPAKEFKGEKPTQKITVRNGQDQVLYELSWGDTYTSKLKYNKGMTLFYTKTNLEKDIMGVTAVSIQTLISHELLANKTDKK